MPDGGRGMKDIIKVHRWFKEIWAVQWVGVTKLIPSYFPKCLPPSVNDDHLKPISHCKYMSLIISHPKMVVCYSKTFFISGSAIQIGILTFILNATFVSHTKMVFRLPS